MSIRRYPFRNAALGFVREGREWVLPVVRLLGVPGLDRSRLAERAHTEQLATPVRLMLDVERKAISYEKWQADRAVARARAEEVDKALPPYERTRPRDPDEARVLRSFGTPERLIGPTRTA